MKTGNVCGMLILVVVAGLSSGAAWAAGAGPEVTVSISGSLSEMLPVLQLLRNMGFGFESPEDTAQALRLEVHSVVRDTDLLEDRLGAGVPGVVPEAESESPGEEALPLDKLGLYNAAVEPAAAAPGASVTVSVAAGDPNRVVDTVGARIVGEEGARADLYDDGSHGDAIAADGTWACSMILPESMIGGPHHIEVVAYDKYGDPVTDEDGEPLLVRIPLTVSK